MAGLTRLRENRKRSRRPVEKHFQERSAELQIPQLRYASVEMTKGRVALPFKLDAAEDEQQVLPLRFAPVGMTLLFRIGMLVTQTRSVIPTVAKRSGGTCCFSLGFSRRHFSPEFSRPALKRTIKVQLLCATLKRCSPLLKQGAPTKLVAERIAKFRFVVFWGRIIP
jgi:hypothetical protein